MPDRIKSHNFILENRSKLLLSGIHEVGSFNDNEIIIYSSVGELNIKGKELQIVKVSIETGDMEITGRIDSVNYSDNIEKVSKNFITKLLK